MSNNSDIKEIKEDVAEIKRLLKNAGFTNCSPARIYEINQKAKRDADRLRKLLNVDKRDRA